MALLQSIPLARDCDVVLHRTLRIPDDGAHYPLPPSLGPLPVLEVGPDRFAAPLRRAEAMWIGFRAPVDRPRALKVGIGGVDAISGETFAPRVLSADPQDYVVIPDQPWLDGINAGDGFIRQFVAVPLGEGLTIEAQLTGREVEGGLELSLFDPVRPVEVHRLHCCNAPPPAACAAPMGLGAGGRMRQEVYADPHGLDMWKAEPARTVRVELIDALAFEALTGIRAPGPPVDAATYTSHGLPWFELLAPTRQDIAAAEKLASIRSIADLEGRDEPALPIPETQIRRLLKARVAT